MRRMSYIFVCCHIRGLSLCEFRECRIYSQSGAPESLAERIDAREDILMYESSICSEYTPLSI